MYEQMVIEGVLLSFDNMTGKPDHQSMVKRLEAKIAEGWIVSHIASGNRAAIAVLSRKKKDENEETA